METTAMSKAQKFIDKITYNKESKKKILKILKEHVKENDNCRVGFAVEQVLGRTENHIIQKVSAAFTKSGKYSRQLSEVHRGDYDVFRNSSYRNQLLHDFIVAVISAALSLGAGYLLLRKDNQEKSQQIERLEKRVEDLIRPSKSQ